MKQYMNADERRARAQKLTRDGLGESCSCVVYLPACSSPRCPEHGRKRDYVHDPRWPRHEEGTVVLCDGREISFGGLYEFASYAPVWDDYVGLTFICNGE